MPQLPPSPRSSCARFFVLLLALLAFFSAPRAGLAYVLNAQEAALADLLENDPGQTRGTMQLDPILSQVARERAADMAARNYFAHTNPDGLGPNALVRAAGYTLPSWWGTVATDNFIESLAAGRSLASETWTDLLNSPSHRTHLLATDSFYRNQTSYGIGYAPSPTGAYRHYWVILTAPPNSSVSGNAALFVAQSAPGGLAPGQTASVSVSMLNTGSNTWTQAAGYQLIALNPVDSLRWGLSRVNLPNSVSPGNAVNFSFVVTAPSYGGSSAFQWQMNNEGAGPFGEQSPLRNIPVSNPTPPPAPASAYTAPAATWSSSSSSSSKSKKKKKKAKKKKKKSKKN